MGIETVEKVNIIKDAGLLLGEPELQSLNDDTQFVRTANRRFEQLLEDSLTKGEWRFAVKKATLSRLVAAPLNEGTYAYQLPSDYLLAVAPWPRRTNFAIHGDTLYTNASALALDYLYKCEPSDLPAYFALLMTYRVAMECSVGVTELASRYEIAREKYLMQLSSARATDARAYPNSAWDDSPVTDVRR